MFEYQTAISELTGLPVSNATLYEAPSAVASAGWLAQAPERPRPVPRLARPAPALARGARDHRAGYGTAVEEVPLARGVTDVDALRAAIGDDVSAVFLQLPNFLGAVEDLEAIAPVVRESGALLVVQCDPLTLGMLRPPGEFGVDIAVGRASRWATGSTSAAPRSASSPPAMRTCAGCRAGSPARRRTSTGAVASCSRCRRASSTSGARRPRTTSHRADAERAGGLVYLSWLGRRGIVELGELLLHRTAYARRALAALEGVELLHEQPVVREFAVRLDAPVDQVIERCAAEGVNPGYRLGADYDEYGDGCWWRSPSSARRPTSTGWPRCSAPRSQPSARR